MEVANLLALSELEAAVLVSEFSSLKQQIKDAHVGLLETAKQRDYWSRRAHQAESKIAAPKEQAAHSVALALGLAMVKK